MLKREATICSLNVVTKKSRELMVTLTTTSNSLGTMMILMASTIQTKEEVGEAITKADCRMTVFLFRHQYHMPFLEHPPL